MTSIENSWPPMEKLSTRSNMTVSPSVIIDFTSALMLRLSTSSWDRMALIPLWTPRGPVDKESVVFEEGNKPDPG